MARHLNTFRPVGLLLALALLGALSGALGLSEWPASRLSAVAPLGDADVEWLLIATQVAAPRPAQRRCVAALLLAGAERPRAALLLSNGATDAAGALACAAPGERNAH